MIAAEVAVEYVHPIMPLAEQLVGMLNMGNLNGSNWTDVLALSTVDRLLEEPDPKVLSLEQRLEITRDLLLQPNRDSEELFYGILLREPEILIERFGLTEDQIRAHVYMTAGRAIRDQQNFLDEQYALRSFGEGSLRGSQGVLRDSDDLINTVNNIYGLEMLRNSLKETRKVTVKPTPENG
jgi:hypothetical protein